MTISSASKMIARLIDLAQKGDIDPWNVQVIDVIDRFLDELGMNHDLEPGHQQTNLLKSGQVFLWASMLVRFKADTLEKLKFVEDKGEDELYFNEIPQNFSNCSLPLYLEQKLRRRTAVFPPRQLRVSISELITLLPISKKSLRNWSAPNLLVFDDLNNLVMSLVKKPQKL